VSFRININILLECLTIFGSSSMTEQGMNPSLKLRYDGYGEPLSLVLEEG